MDNFRQEQLQEAVQRMHILDIYENPIKELQLEERILNKSENGILYWLDDKEMELVKKWEEKSGHFAYHAILSKTELGNMLDVLYVIKYTDEWELERGDLKALNPLSYCIVGNSLSYAEYGSIGIKLFFGGVIRTA